MAVEAIRNYERVGLLSRPGRMPCSYRVYRPQNLKGLSFIRHAGGLGFEVSEIRSLLDPADHPKRDSGEADSIATSRLDTVEIKIVQRQLLRAEFTKMFSACRGGRVIDCRLLEVLGNPSLCQTDHKGTCPCSYYRAQWLCRIPIWDDVLRLRLTTRLAISADAAAALVATPVLLKHVAAPLLRFAPVDPPNFPQVWEERPYRVRVRLLGLLPLGRQCINISHGVAPDGTFLMRDNGSGDLARRWDHRIIISPEGESSCTYVDDVDIEAGILTRFVWSFALLFYSHRQRRWRRLAANMGWTPAR